MEEDDDDFIYGTSSAVEPAPPQAQSAPVAEPQPVKPIQPLDGGEDLLRERSPSMDQPAENTDETEVKQEEQPEEEDEDEEEEEEEEEEESEESDIEIIVDPEERNRAMHRDFRPQGGHRTASFGTPMPTSGTPPPSARAPHLTTEYTTIPRGEIPAKPTAPPPLPLPALKQPSEEPKLSTTPAQDPSTLPPARAPPSHPPINPEEPGTIDNRSIFEIDMDALAEKPWRRPGTDISDYFNYGFDEISWEAYCYRRRELGEMANHLKGVVTNFAGMPEEQIAALPPDVRAMVMSGATQLMNGGGMPGGPGMMVGGPGPMMQDMGMMGMMNGGDVQAMQAGMMQGSEGDVMGMQGMPQDGFQGGGPGGPGGPMMGMGQEFGMQDPNGMGIFPQNVDGGGTPAQTSTPILPQGPAVGPSPIPGGVSGSVNPPTGPAAGRLPPAAPQGGFRGRGVSTPPMGMVRGRGGFGRGRGRGGMYMPDGPQVPVRPASPLPPNVPTGPRNQNRYKDRDNNAQAVDGLDYGGGMQTSSDLDDRASRKRRGSPSAEDGRSSKRR